jgi:2-C-methyl-D-erythritol 4-phosphate cytidylyltransferase
MGPDVDKVFHMLAGTPVLLHTLRAFEAASSIHTIVIVTRPDRLNDAQTIAQQITKPTTICEGGARRQDSVTAGLEALQEDTDVVSVHDAARPFVTPAEIDQGVALAREKGGAVVGYPATDTIKRATPDGEIVDTPPRRELWQVQTPQTFQVDLLRRAHAATTDDATDDAAVVERLGARLWIYPGSRRNIKITTPEDLIVAEALLRASR